MSKSTKELAAMVKEYDEKFNFNSILNEMNDNYDYLYNNHDNYSYYDEAIQIFDDYFSVAHKDFIVAFANYIGDFVSSDREIVAFMVALYETGTLYKMGLLEEGEHLIEIRNKEYFYEIAGDKYIRLDKVEDKLINNYNYLQENNDKIHSYGWYLNIFNELIAKESSELIEAHKLYSDRTFEEDREKVAFAMALDNLNYYEKANIYIEKSLDKQLEECKPETNINKNFTVKSKSL